MVNTIFMINKIREQNNELITNLKVNQTKINDSYE